MSGRRRTPPLSSRSWNSELVGSEYVRLQPVGNINNAFDRIRDLTGVDVLQRHRRRHKDQIIVYDDAADDHILKTSRRVHDLLRSQLPDRRVHLEPLGARAGGRMLEEDKLD